MKTKATITTEEAAVMMREAGIPIETTTLRDGIEQGIFPFGVCIARSRKVFIVFKKKFAEWLFDVCGEMPTFND
jgi:hypothetical protein